MLYYPWISKHTTSGCSSAGRANACQALGHRFEPGHPLQLSIMEITEFKLQNPGILKTQVPADLFEQIKKDLNWYRGEDYNENLVGHIEDEREFIITDKIQFFLEELAEHYHQRFNIKDFRVVSHLAWVNLQKKHEFNPCHLHDSTLSWVLWVKIPYRLEDEDNLPNTIKTRYSLNSRFQFFYNQLDGKQAVQTLDIDQSWQGTILLFPSTLRHTVYPFYTSDQARISIAGNIYATFTDQ